MIESKDLVIKKWLDLKILHLESYVAMKSVYCHSYWMKKYLKVFGSSGD